MADLISPESPFKKEVIEYLEASGIKDQSADILGPFTDITHQVVEALWNAFLPGSPGASLSWELLSLTLVIAILFFVFRRGTGAKDAGGRARPTSSLLQYILPSDIYTHPSARVDIWLYVIDRAMMPVWVLLFLGAVAPFVETATIGSLQWAFGASPAVDPTIAWRVVYGLVTILIADMIFYWTHYMMHKTKIGWAIHKVHHSAQVLTPLTRPREHFIAGPIWALGPGIGLSLSGGIFAWVFDGSITQITLWNVGIFSLLYAFNGNFRHYHISFRYPRWLEKWLQSPGLHHTHHSYLEKHWDTNLGLVTSVWDRMMGTLYIPARDEATPWGLTPDEQASYTTLSDNLLTPFREIYSILGAKWRSHDKGDAAKAKQATTEANS